MSVEEAFKEMIEEVAGDLIDEKVKDALENYTPEISADDVDGLEDAIQSAVDSNIDEKIDSAISRFRDDFSPEIEAENITGLEDAIETEVGNQLDSRLEEAVSNTLPDHLIREIQENPAVQGILKKTLEEILAPLLKPLKALHVGLDPNTPAEIVEDKWKEMGLTVES